MPNGGSDCCGECWYNKAIQDYGQPDIGELDRFNRSTYCTLRKVAIWGAPFYTYCQNYNPDRDRINYTVEIRGPIRKQGLVTENLHHCRIPWFGAIEPLVGARVSCAVCRKRSHKGIRLDFPDGTKIGFCSNEHYLEWVRLQDIQDV